MCIDFLYPADSTKPCEPNVFFAHFFLDVAFKEKEILQKFKVIFQIE